MCDICWPDRRGLVTTASANMPPQSPPHIDFDAQPLREVRATPAPPDDTDW